MYLGFKLLLTLSLIIPFRLSEVQYRLAVLYKQHRKFEQSLSMFRAILNNPPRPLSKTDVYFNIGGLYEVQGNTQAAKETYEQILQQDPKHAKVLLFIKIFPLTLRLSIPVIQ